VAEEVLRRTERLATAGRLAATVAHEVNNPLESVTNLIFICQNEPGVSEGLRQYLKMADEELRRVAHIVRQTLGFYREDSAPQATDLSLLASDLIQFYRRRFQSRQVELISHLEPNVVITVVAGEIRQVMANLLANALDASSGGGVVSISVSKQGENARIEVKDSGHGISDDNRKNSLSRSSPPSMKSAPDWGYGSQGVLLRSTKGPFKWKVPPSPRRTVRLSKLSCLK
jgi:signal transduction histidine kinase